MTIRGAIIVVLWVLGCTQPADPTAEARTEVLREAGNAGARLGDPGPPTVSESGSAVVGSYYRGDGLGFNLSLTLARDGTFRCKWTGCLGVYGNTAGTWLREGDRIVTRTAQADGMFEGDPLGDLEVVQNEGETLLIQTNDRDFFEKWGPSRYSAFSRAK